MRISTPTFVNAMNNVILDPNEQNIKIFEDEIKKTKFITPGMFFNKNEKHLPIENRNVNFVNITDANGDKFFLAFTDTEKFDVFKKDNDFEKIDAELAHFKYLLEEVDEEAKGFVINIKDEALFISRDTFATKKK